MQENNMCSMYNSVISTVKKLKPNKKILYFEGKIVTAAKFITSIDKLAFQLKKLGIKNGDVITMNLPNLPNSVLLFYAVNKLGAIINSLHPLLPPEYLIKSIENTKSKLLITFDNYYYEGAERFNLLNCKTLVCSVSDYLPFAKKIAYKLLKERKFSASYNQNVIKYKNIINKNHYENFNFETNKVAVYLHSGGTTNSPKTVVLSGDAFNSLRDSLRVVVPNMDPLHHVCLMVLPLFHGFGLGVCMHSFLSFGFEIVLVPKFNAKSVAIATKKEGITCFSGVPLMYEKFMNLDGKLFSCLSSLEHIFSGGDKLSDSLKKDFDLRLRSINSTAEVLEGYGLTECVTVCTVNRENDFEENSMGYPLKGIELKIVDTSTKKVLSPLEKGEICISGGTLMEGYLEGDEQSLIIDGKRFIRSGDYGYLDEKGKLFFIDRLKKIIKIGGVTIFPSDIERVLSEIEGISNSVVVYDKDTKKIAAHIETQRTDKKLLEQEIFNLCKEKLIAYSVPKKVVFYDKLPRTIVGKIKV